MSEKWDVVIVGGGLAGYVAAHYLAKANLSILIIEKGTHTGGRARTNKVNQQLFNLGPHALFKKGKARSILEQLGIQLNGKSPDLNGKLIEGMVEYTAPLSPIGLFTSRLLKGKARYEWMSILLKIMSIEPEHLAEQTYQQWINQIGYSDKIKSLLYVLGRLATYCHAPELASAKVIVTSIKHALGGALYIDGGWQTIIDQLHNKAISLGIQVNSHTLVKHIHPQQNQFKLILSGDRELHAKYVVCTTGPHELKDMLQLNDDQLYINSFLSEITAVRGATLDLALTQLPNPKLLFAMGINAPLYYSVHSKFARLSNDDKHVILHVFKYLHPHENIDQETIKTELEQFLDRLQPGWQHYVIAKRFIPNITVNQRLPQIGDEQKLLRLQTDMPGLYLAGDWASPNFILADGAVSSAKQTAEAIILNEKVRDSANYERGIPLI